MSELYARDGHASQGNPSGMRPQAAAPCNLVSVGGGETRLRTLERFSLWLVGSAEPTRRAHGYMGTSQRIKKASSLPLSEKRRSLRASQAQAGTV